MNLTQNDRLEQVTSDTLIEDGKIVAIESPSKYVYSKWKVNILFEHQLNTV